MTITKISIEPFWNLNVLREEIAKYAMENHRYLQVYITVISRGMGLGEFPTAPQTCCKLRKKLCVSVEM